MFTVVDSALHVPRQAQSQIFLIVDYWDDWFSFRTMFTIIVFDQLGNRHTPGSVKIGQAGLLPSRGGENLPPGTRRPDLPQYFEALNPAQHFSLGQDEDYYATLRSLPNGLGMTILERLCDCAYNLHIFAQHQNELVMRQSLLRSVHEPNVRHRLNRLAHGNAVLTRFEFEYTLPVFTYRRRSSPPSTNYDAVPCGPGGRTSNKSACACR